MRWRWQVDRTWEDIDELPAPLGFLFGSFLAFTKVRELVLFFFVLGVAVACLVVGTTLAGYIGAALLVVSLLIAFGFLRSHLSSRDP